MQILLNDATISTSGSTVLDGVDSQTLCLLINLKNAPAGTNPALIFTLADVDPVDVDTVVGNSVSTSVLTGVIGTHLILSNSVSSFVKVSWTLDGYDFPEFTGVNLSATEKISTNLFSNDATLFNVSASASSVTLLSANSKRIDASIFNDSTDNLFVKLGTAASTSSFTVKVLPGGYYELPSRYLGRIDGISSGTNGEIRITEHATI